MHSAVPVGQLEGQKYISLATFRRSGQQVLTPVWFAAESGRLFIMTRSDSGKFKRIRNNPAIRVAACTARGKVTGDWFDGQARILPSAEEAAARRALARKYFLLRFPWLWSRKNIFLEIILAA